MKTVIVEKQTIRDGSSTQQFAVATSQRSKHSRAFSLTYEAYLTPWDTRENAEKLQAEIELEPEPDQETE